MAVNAVKTFYMYSISLRTLLNLLQNVHVTVSRSGANSGIAILTSLWWITVFVNPNAAIVLWVWFFRFELDFLSGSMITTQNLINITNHTSQLQRVHKH